MKAHLCVVTVILDPLFEPLAVDLSHEHILAKFDKDVQYFYRISPMPSF